MEGRATITVEINATYPTNNQKLIKAEDVRAFMDIINESKFNLVDDDISSIKVNANSNTTLDQEINGIVNNFNSQISSINTSKLEVALDWEYRAGDPTYGYPTINNNFGPVSGSPSNFNVGFQQQTIRCNFSSPINGRYVVVTEGYIDVLTKTSTYCDLRRRTDETTLDMNYVTTDWQIQILRTA